MINKENYKIVVLAKQVPDTRNVGKDAMKEDGTINRAALPAVFNPDDLKALEMALQIKDVLGNATVTVITMGPPRAADIVREAMFRGADDGFVVSDRKFAGSDTLATSYTLSLAIKYVGEADFILSGRQAIDGDTAQVGPQVAEKLNMPQITYAEELISVDNQNIVVKRRIDRGVEIVKSAFPVLITVHGNAKDCRPRHAKRVIKFKKAMTQTEINELANGNCCNSSVNILKIGELSADMLNPDNDRLGLVGSPTKVKTIENVVLTSKDNKKISNNEGEINEMIQMLINTHII